MFDEVLPEKSKRQQMSSSILAVKASYGDELRRFSVPTDTITLSDICKTLWHIFGMDLSGPLISIHVFPILSVLSLNFLDIR